MATIASNRYCLVICLTFLVISEGVRATDLNEAPESKNVTQSEDLSTKQNETSSDSIEEVKPKDDSVVLITGGKHIDTFHSVEVLDPLSTGCHPSFAPLPSHTFLGHSTHFVAPDKVFLVGGYTTQDGKNCLILNNNGGKLEFKKHSLLKVPRSFHRGVVVDQTIWIFGGVGVTDKTESFNATATELGWREEAVTAGAWSKCSVAIGNKSVVDTGGERGPNSITDVNQLDTEEGTWSVLKAMKTARMNHACVYLEDSGVVLVAGGQKSSEKKEDEYLKSTEMYHVGSGEWEEVGDLVEARSHGQVVEVGGRVLFIGGTAGKGENRKETVEEFNLETKTWSMVDNLRLQHGRDVGFSAVVVPAKLLGCGVTAGVSNVAAECLWVALALLAVVVDIMQ